MVTASPAVAPKAKMSRSPATLIEPCMACPQASGVWAAAGGASAENRRSSAHARTAMDAFGTLRKVPICLSRFLRQFLTAPFAGSRQMAGRYSTTAAGNPQIAQSRHPEQAQCSCSLFPCPRFPAFKLPCLVVAVGFGCASHRQRRDSRIDSQVGARSTLVQDVKDCWRLSRSAQGRATGCGDEEIAIPGKTPKEVVSGKSGFINGDNGFRGLLVRRFGADAPLGEKLGSVGPK